MNERLISLRRRWKHSTDSQGAFSDAGRVCPTGFLSNKYSKHSSSVGSLMGPRRKAASSSGELSLWAGCEGLRVVCPTDYASQAGFCVLNDEVVETLLRFAESAGIGCLRVAPPPDGWAQGPGLL